MSMTKLIGRNNNQIEIINDLKCMKKKLVGTIEDIKRRQGNLEQWERHLPENFHSPILIRKDELNGEYVYQWIESSRTIQEIFQNSLGAPFDESLFDIFTKIALLLAKIHMIIPVQCDQENSVKLLSRPLIALTPEEYANASGAELECLSLLQSDARLLQSLCDYATRSNYKAMIHGDIRLDQFLYSLDNKVWIIDFEEYSLGDALKDLGGIIGSVLFDVYLKIFCDSWEFGDEVSDEQAINEYLLKREKELLREVSPLLKQFLDTYQSESGQTVDTELLSINLGAFLLERVLSRAKLSFRLSAIDKAIMGVGREFIISNHRLSKILL